MEKLFAESKVNILSLMKKFSLPKSNHRIDRNNGMNIDRVSNGIKCGYSGYTPKY